MSWGFSFSKRVALARFGGSWPQFCGWTTTEKERTMSIITEMKNNLIATAKSTQDRLISDLQAEVAELKAGFILMSETLQVPEPVTVEEIEALMKQNKQLKKLANIQKKRNTNQKSLDSLIEMRASQTIALGKIFTAYDNDIAALEKLLA